MAITKVLIARKAFFGAIRPRLGAGEPVRIAHCVGDVDKRTVSENLGSGVERPRLGQNRHRRRPGWLGRRMRTEFREHRTVAPIVIT